MKRILNVILAVLVFTFLSSVSKGQSEMVYDSGTDINVTTGADICADAVTINGTFSGDGTQCNSALPVELSSFSAIVKGDKVELNWQTATEVNNYGFEIQRSVVSSQQSAFSGLQSEWETIGFVNGHGNSNSPKQYSFTDNLLNLNLNLSLNYRLKQIDADGSFEYSKEIEAAIDKPTVFSLAQNYPNPFNPATKISYQIPADNLVTLKIFDVLGKEAATLINADQTAGSYEVTFNAANLPSGVYFYKIEAGSFVSVKKLLLMK